MADGCSKRLENRADDRAREVGGQAIHRDALVADERRDVLAGAGAGQLVFVGERQRRVLPQRLAAP